MDYDGLSIYFTEMVAEVELVNQYMRSDKSSYNEIMVKYNNYHMVEVNKLVASSTSAICLYSVRVSSL